VPTAIKNEVVSQIKFLSPYDVVLARHQKNGVISGYTDTYLPAVSSANTVMHATKICAGHTLELLLFHGSGLLRIETARELSDYLKIPFSNRPPALVRGRLIKTSRFFSAKITRNRSVSDLFIFSCFGIAVIEIKAGAHHDSIKSPGQCASIRRLVKSLSSSASNLGYNRVDAFLCTFNAPPESKIFNSAKKSGVVLLSDEELCAMIQADVAQIHASLSAPARANTESFVKNILNAYAKDGGTDPALMAAVKAYQKASVDQEAALCAPSPIVGEGHELILEILCAKAKASARIVKALNAI
jgi:hypothetical protein